MIDLGYYSLVFCWFMTLFGIAALWFSRRQASPLRQTGYRAVIASFLLLTAASGALLGLLATHDFRVQYVAAYTSLDLPMVYVLTAFWGGQSGSLLLWTFLLGLFSVLVVIGGRGKREEMIPYAALVILVTQHFFLSVMLYAANPFAIADVIQADGRGLNPLLQNFFMVIHPPFLYLGYVAFTVPFAYAIAALFLGRTDSEWLRASRRWTLVSWIFLTAGILLGAYWAYIELGWGGYWAWDPVENASLMPWLVATAFLHSALAEERQGLFRRWNFALIILTFELCIFGTFLTRSGIVTSVHAFADSQMKDLFLIFMISSTVICVGLLLFRARQTRPARTVTSILSKESALLAVNVLFLGLTLAVFWGTMYPAFSELLGGEKVSITAGFFNRVTWPLALAVIALAAVAPLLSWQSSSVTRLRRGLTVPVIISVLFGIGLVFFGARDPIALAFFVACCLMGVRMVLELLRAGGSRQSSDERERQAFIPALISHTVQHRRRYGAVTAHLGIALTFIGILASSTYTRQYDLTLNQGKVVPFGEYRAEMVDFHERPEVGKDVVYAKIRVYKNGRLIGVAQPEKHFHRKFEQPQTEVSILPKLKEDIYIVLMGWEQNGTVFARVNINPGIWLLWLGGLIILAGGVVVLFPARQIEVPEASTASSDTPKPELQTEMSQLE